MEFRFDDLNWDEFGAHVLNLLFESVNYKRNYLYIFAFVLQHSVFLL